MSPILHHGRMAFTEFEARALADWKKAWREETSDWQDDPMPRLYLYADGHRMLHMHPIPFEWFQSRPAKTRLTTVIVELVKAGECSMVALCHTVMAIKHQEGDDLASNDLPERITGLMEQHKADNLTELLRFRPDLVEEQAAVWLVDREIGKSWAATVKRKRGQPPRLVDWQQFDLGGGYLFGPIQEALR